MLAASWFLFDLSRYLPPDLIFHKSNGNRMDRMGDPLFDLGKLGAQAFNKRLQPTGHIHVVFPDTLNCLVECGTISVIIFTDGKQPFEIVSGPVRA